MIQTTFALIIFLFPLAYSPGPGNMFFAANGARFGFWSTVPANTGYHIATWIVTAAIGFGFVKATGNAPQLFAALKVAGSFYVLWLAWKIFRSGTNDLTETAQPAGLMSGVALLLLNPKAYVIITLMFTQFLDQSDFGKLLSVVLITTVFTLNNLIAFCVWTLIGDKIADRFRSPDKAKILNATFGAILAAVAIWMLLS